jgi:hypothetical protein
MTQRGNLKRHLWEVHGVGNGAVHGCTQDGCEHTTKNKASLKQHLLRIHGVGNVVV